ncbi:hypothetical protein GJAV_G00008030 [Gymnothorax javanicus]|nr:hypothetical protein GJAV_G00008030 [Gymnothorax javanicus]
MHMEAAKPKLILLFSGKRKSGKDYVTNLIHQRLGSEVCCILRLSAPLKELYALERGLDFKELLSSRQYKEQYRADMIAWGETRRDQDPGFFCRLAQIGAAQPIWIVSDARRLSDLQWFSKEYPGKTRCIRVEASEQTRHMRGWVFTPGIDDAESECGLDDGVMYDWIIRNDDAAPLEEQLQALLSLAQDKAGADAC